jgi:hypothetical protein
MPRALRLLAAIALPSSVLIHRSVHASIRLPHRTKVKQGISKLDPALNQDPAGRKGLCKKSNELWMA